MTEAQDDGKGRFARDDQALLGGRECALAAAKLAFHCQSYLK